MYIVIHQHYLQMTHISIEHVSAYRQSYHTCPHRKAIANVVANNPLSKLHVVRDACQQYQHHYNITTTPKPKATNQKSSGRCWLFAALNVVRREMITKYKVTDFEFSQSHLFFWDKLERLNYGMEAIIATKDQCVSSREVAHLLHDPACDGGQWDMFCNLVRKYGLMPKSVYRETHHSSNSTDLNVVLTRKFREYALQLRACEQPHAHKQVCLAEVYSILCQFMGEPPSHFTWHYRHSETNDAHQVANVSPIEFYRHHVPLDVNDFVCVVNDPRNPYDQLYTVKFLGNVSEGQPICYMNLPIAQLRELALASLQLNQTVWFGCDVMQHFDRSQCAMDVALVNHASLLGIEYGMDKTQRLEHGESLMTHAMVLTGARTTSERDTVRNCDTHQVSDWEVENSWSDSGPTKGFYNMSDEWFDAYVFEVVVPRRVLSEKQQSRLNAGNVTELPPWDPMGALAT